MSDIRLRPRKATELIDAAFALYRRDAAMYTLAAAIASIPYIGFQLLIAGDPANLVTGLTALSVAGSFATGIISYTLLLAVIAKLGAEAYLGGTPDLAAALRHTLPRLPALIGAGILKWIVLVFSMLLFLFPALYVAARWFGVATVIVLEEPGVIGAFSRSAALSRGRKWHVLNTLGLIGIITLALAIGMMWLASLTGSAVVGVVLNGALGIVIYPVSGLVDVLLYYDTRIRDEGFDLEHMAHALDVDAVPAVAPAVAPAVVRVVVPAVAPAPQA